MQSSDSGATHHRAVQHLGAGNICGGISNRNLKVMTVRLVTEAFLTVPLLGKNLDESGVVSDPGRSYAIRSALVAFADAISLVEPNGGGRCG